MQHVIKLRAKRLKTKFGKKGETQKAACLPTCFFFNLLLIHFIVKADELMWQLSPDCSNNPMLMTKTRYNSLNSAETCRRQTT